MPSSSAACNEISGGLTEMSPHSLEHLSICSPTNDTDWEVKEVWPCWRKYVTEGNSESLKMQANSSLLYLFPACSSRCEPLASVPAIMLLLAATPHLMANSYDF